MILRKWEELPEKMQCREVRQYYDALSQRKWSLLLKRIFDICLAIILLVILSPLFLIITIAVVLDSKGCAFFLQERVTAYGKRFKIIKFRTMITDAEKKGQLTTSNDDRITRIGRFLRKCRLDEIPQLINILTGDMSFVGTRPEVPIYVDKYSPEMLATLLLPAGVTSEASILYKDEQQLLNNADDADRTYIEKVLPCKMYYNLKAIMNFSIVSDIRTMVRTVLAVCGKKFQEELPSDITHLAG